MSKRNQPSNKSVSFASSVRGSSSSGSAAEWPDPTTAYTPTEYRRYRRRAALLERLHWLLQEMAFDDAFRDGMPRDQTASFSPEAQQFYNLLQMNAEQLRRESLCDADSDVNVALKWSIVGMHWTVMTVNLFDPVMKAIRDRQGIAIGIANLERPSLRDNLAARLRSATQPLEKPAFRNGTHHRHVSLLRDACTAAIDFCTVLLKDTASPANANITYDLWRPAAAERPGASEVRYRALYGVVRVVGLFGADHGDAERDEVWLAPAAGLRRIVAGYGGNPGAVFEVKPPVLLWRPEKAKEETRGQSSKGRK